LGQGLPAVLRVPERKAGEVHSFDTEMAPIEQLGTEGHTKTHFTKGNPVPAACRTEGGWMRAGAQGGRGGPPPRRLGRPSGGGASGEAAWDHDQACACGARPVDAKFREAFGVAVCRTCRLQEALVSKSKALERYLLKEKDRECTRRRRYGRSTDRPKTSPGPGNDRQAEPDV